MWRNRSLIYPAILFLLLVIGATLAVGYTVNFAILEDVLQERMARQARYVGGEVLHALNTKVQQLERFRDSWMKSASWEEEAETDPRLVSGTDADSQEAMWKHLSELLPLWGVDFILLLDPAGNLTHRMPTDLWNNQSPLPAALVEQVRATTSQHQAVWRVAQVADKWQILLFAPVKISVTGDNHIVVFGQGLERVVSKLQRENPATPFVIAAANGIAAGDANLLKDTNFQAATAAATIRDNTPRMVFDSALPVNLYYTPISFLDQTFSLVVPVALDEVRQVLANSRQRLIISILCIVVLLVIFGIGLEQMVLRPLRNLRQKAALMVRACSGEEQVIYLNPMEHGNEIAMLERAIEDSSIKLYAHVAHLVNTKQLLEGLTLKDPITMLGNRRMLDEFLGYTLGSCKRKERQVAVILIEPEPLEKLAKPATSAERDQIMRELANRLRKQLRGEDLAFRINHNEFVAFAPECGDEEQVLSLVHRLHRLLAAPYSLPGGGEVTITVRIGIAVFPGAGENVNTLLANARVALARVHREGGYPYSIYNYPDATVDDDDTDEE